MAEKYRDIQKGSKEYINNIGLEEPDNKTDSSILDTYDVDKDCIEYRIGFRDGKKSYITDKEHQRGL